MARTALKQTGVNDFTGGLNLGPPQEMAINEVAFARDVVFSSRGGVATRPGFRPFSGTLLGLSSDRIQVAAHVHYRQADSTYQLFGQKINGQALYWSEGGGWFPTGINPGNSIVGTETTSRFVVGLNGAQYLTNSYFAKANNDFVTRWDGYTSTILADEFSDDIGNPVGNNAPRCMLIANKGDFMFTAITYENGVVNRNRLRWSHPGNAEAWRTEDFVDMPAPITAIVAFRDFLAIFTNENMYGLYGDSADSFQIQEISATSGTPFHWCVTSSASTLYWWDWDQGVMAMGAGAPRNIMGSIKPYFDRGGFVPDEFNSIDATSPPPNLLWGEGRLYVKVLGGLNPRVYPTGLGNLFIFDPSVGRDGAWTTYSGLPNDGYGLATFPRATKNDLVVAAANAHLMVLNDSSQHLDRNFLYDATDKRPPQSVVRTAPFEGDTNATKKRWRRPRVTIRSASTRQRIKFGYLKNYFEGGVTEFRNIDLNFLDLAAVPSGIYAGDGWTDLFPSIDTGRWDAAGGGVTAAGDLAMALTAGGNTQTLTTDIQYDMTDAAISAQITAGPTGTATTSLLFWDGNENARMHVSGGGFLIASWRDSAGAVTTVFSTTFNATTTDWVRIREDSGQLVFEYGADGSTWTVAHSMAWPFVDAPSDKWSIQFQAVPPAAGSQTVRWDNFRYAPEGAIFDTDDYAELADNAGEDIPDNSIQFETLPSAGAGNVFQMEFSYTETNGQDVDYRDTNRGWGIDSIVLPYREKGVR